MRLASLKEQGIFGKWLTINRPRIIKKKCKITTLTLQQACWVTLHLPGLQIKSNGI